MSVPLDRLYNFLHDLCNHDIVIYRFYPHGSRKPSDCAALFEPNEVSVAVRSAMYMVCHDQEPLTSDIYNAHKSKMLHTLIRKQFLLHSKILLLHSEKNSQFLDVLEQGDAIGVYWWSHAIIAKDWFRYAEIDPSLSVQKIPNYDFLIYNRAWAGTREYRLKFSELIVNENLYQNCFMNFSVVDADEHYHNHQFANPSLQIHQTDLEKYFQKNIANATYSADYNSTDYAQCRIEVVLETLFDDSRLHLTEKSLRPIACKTPFILAATAGSLEYLKSYGFKTFDQWIDESYDTVQDPLGRLNAIVKSMKQFSSNTAERKSAMLSEMQEICNYNYARFFSKEFTETILSEFKRNVALGTEKVRASYGADFKKLMRGFGSVKNAESMFTRDELVEIWMQIRNN